MPEAMDLQLKVNVESEGEPYLNKAAQTQCHKQAEKLHKKWQPAWPALDSLDKATIEKAHGELQGWAAEARRAARGGQLKKRTASCKRRAAEARRAARGGQLRKRMASCKRWAAKKANGELQGVGS